MAALGFTWQACACVSPCVYLSFVVQKPWLTPSALQNVLSLKSNDHLAAAQCSKSTEKQWEGCSNANKLVCTKTHPGGHTLGSETHRGRHRADCVASTCTQHTHTVTCMRPDWLYSTRILVRLKWSFCNYISVGIGKQKLWGSDSL